MQSKLISVIIPARNEVAQLPRTLDAVLRAAARLDDLPMESLHLRASRVEVIVVDDASTDGTSDVISDYAARYGVRRVQAQAFGAARARNRGVVAAEGSVLVFVDADTWLPEAGLQRVCEHVLGDRRAAGIFRLGPQERGVRAWVWWTFWNNVRRLPLPRAKALPAFMFCTRAAFDELGPFDEAIAIGEEWPILAGTYRRNRAGFVYDRSIAALTSSRRMELQRFGYLRLYVKYGLAILWPPARVRYSDAIRE